MHGQKKNKILCLCLPLFLVASCLLVFLPGARAAARSDVVVHTIDVGMRPSAYKMFVSEPATEPVFSVPVSVDGGTYLQGKIKLRGDGSKTIGEWTPGKRFPLELKTYQSDPFAGSLNNSCVKLINSWTPLRLLGEYLALEMYEFLGIPTPSHALAFLRFNGVDFGLYLAEEEVNAECLRKIDPDGGGSLFKADAEDIDSAYNAFSWFGFLRIAEDRGLERADALIEALDRGEGYEAYLDVDEVLRYFACIAVWGAEDSILSENKPSNFFLYDTGERFVLIPWDSSEAFSAYDPGKGIDHFQRDPESKENGPALFTLLMKNESYKKTYHDYVRLLNDGFLAPESLDARVNALAAAADPWLEQDCTMLCNRPDAIHAALETLHKIHENLSAQLNGERNTYDFDPGFFSPLDEDGTDTAGKERTDAKKALDKLESRKALAEQKRSEIMEGSDESEAREQLERLEALEESIDNVSLMIRYYSPRLDPDITEKICAAYPAWCRAQGRAPYDAEDPMEIAVSAAIFLSVFLLLILLTKKHKKRNRFVFTGNGTRS